MFFHREYWEMLINSTSLSLQKLIKWVQFLEALLLFFQNLFMKWNQQAYTIKLIY